MSIPLKFPHTSPGIWQIVTFSIAYKNSKIYILGNFEIVNFCTTTATIVTFLRPYIYLAVDPKHPVG